MKNTRLSRRNFLWLGSGLALSTGLSGCHPASTSVTASFQHGVASGDPTTDRVILWTRVTPEAGSPPEATVEVGFELAKDPDFRQLIQSGTVVATGEQDYTLKVDAAKLQADSLYWYRFKLADAVSTVGRTRTLPSRSASPDKLKFAVFSCANWEFGYFHAYGAATQMLDIDFALHLGDYLYEYQTGGYAPPAGPVRQTVPEKELLQLADYRLRYAQYRTDADLQAIHATLPFICVWDDHEIANDAWRAGAENHDSSEGDYAKRVQGALKAYFEWMPIRPESSLRTLFAPSHNIYRSFDFGTLASLHMLDTRYLGRDLQLNYRNYLDEATKSFDFERFQSDLMSSDRSLLGKDQRTWLQGKIEASQAKWQLLGQQILAGKYALPAPVVLRQISLEDFIKQQGRQKQAQAPLIPYNLDAWDGYHHEREQVLSWMQNSNSSFIVLAGDTHNAWASYLRTDAGELAAVEFGSQSVTSGGLESFLKMAPRAVRQLEKDMTTSIKDLQYINAGDRGFMTLTLTQAYADTAWHFVSDVRVPKYRLLNRRHFQMHTKHGDLTLSSS